MTAFIGEFIGTAILLILGDGVVANVVLTKTKGNNAGLIAITLGWAMAVFVGVYIVAPFSGAHLNPAVTIGLAVADKFPWENVPMYLLAQVAGAFTGAVIVWASYKKHFDETQEAATILAVFSTGPAIRHSGSNLITEIVGTFILVFGVLYIVSPQSSLGALDALPVALLVLGIGLSLGGPTGYAINPARDLGPRIAHAILPIKHKGSSDWGYAWLPVIAPVIGGILAALLYVVLQKSM
jgi:glycerol uptake facilitator protein